MAVIEPRFSNPWCSIFEADARDVAATLEPGSFTLAIFEAKR